ncbi:hypothetical protein K7B10_02555 [Streptomyces flavotricini]|uniref:Uncharacterized protein n=1 Tax=Streptomyces flavotricini TaxID=66888 RepID=A0ABS8DY96_9ACTN|nr:hypothetical protein [Streptomyces flavotricini]MCC0093688.1 hypothetical protein [Streptomyces flavotricini]
MRHTLTSLAHAYELEHVKRAPAGGRDFMARAAAYQERLAQRPDLRHWSLIDDIDPGDDGPTRVLDADLDVWTRLTEGPNRGAWRMARFARPEQEEQPGGALTWRDLAYHYGPLTEDSQ